MCDRICKICGGDDGVAKIAETMGFRPDVAFVKIRRLEKAISDIAPWLSASLSDGTPCQEYIKACEQIFNLDPNCKGQGYE